MVLCADLEFDIVLPNKEEGQVLTGETSADAIVVTSDGASWTAVEAVAAVLERSGRSGRAMAVGLRIPGVHGLAGLVYRWVAGHRGQISARLGLATGCELPKSTS